TMAWKPVTKIRLLARSYLSSSVTWLSAIARASTGSVPSRRNERQGLSSRSKTYSPRRRGSNAKKLSRLAISRRPRRRPGNVGAAAGYDFWRTETEEKRPRTRRQRCRFPDRPNPPARRAERRGVLYNRGQA